MIKQNELRLGNYVKTIHDTLDIIKVTEIKESVIYSDKTKGISYGSLLPIPLTREILLKCGFEQSEWDNYSTFRNLFCQEGSIVISLKNKYIEIGDLTLDFKIKHLHQLQNLYFALTNEELKINL